jgi:three-Cys-motif partner protein
VSKSDDHFRRFRGHTLLKHQILHAYLWAWANKLLRRPQGDRVFFVDAFAGPGKDEEHNPGSPLVAARIAVGITDALSAIPKLRGREMQVVAIEQHPPHAAALRGHLAPFNLNGPRVEVLKGQLLDHIDAVVTRTAGAPTLYFLDPFGIRGLEASTYPKALQGEHNEIFALLADDGVGRLFGLVTATSGGIEARLEQVRNAPSLFPADDQEFEREMRDELEEYQHALDVSQPAARDYLNRALGNTAWERALRECGPEQRRGVFLGLFIEALLSAGAQYVLTIPMRDERGRRKYSLVHASKSVAGFQAMKAAVSTGLRKEFLPAEVRHRIREDLTVDMPEVLAHLRVRFGGKEAGWVNEVQPYLLGNSGVFDFQLPALRAALETAGQIVRGPKGKLSVRVPA